MLNRYGPCIGFRLWKWNNFQIEIWFVPARYKIPKHSHDNQDIELTHIFGKAKFAKELQIDYFKKFTYQPVKEADVSFSDIGLTFSIPKGTLHWFEVSNWPLIFLSRETWYTKPTSAAKDFNKKEDQ